MRNKVKTSETWYFNGEKNLLITLAVFIWIIWYLLRFVVCCFSCRSSLEIWMLLARGVHWLYRDRSIYFFNFYAFLKSKSVAVTLIKIRRRGSALRISILQFTCTRASLIRKKKVQLIIVRSLSSKSLRTRNWLLRGLTDMHFRILMHDTLPVSLYHNDFTIDSAHQREWNLFEKCVDLGKSPSGGKRIFSVFYVV